jgi:ribonuclease BN (tRNA processing enzyme)
MTTGGTKGASPREPVLTFHGVRGSTPCDGQHYARYGGSTSSVSLEAKGHAPVIFDLGTGVRAYGDVVTAQQVVDLTANRAASPYHANVLLTHLHWDHIIGLPFFTPAFRPDARIVVHGPRQPEGSLGEVFAGVMRPPYFPITPDQLGGDVRFVDVANDAFALNGAKVTSRWVRHTDPALGFRVDLEGRSVTYISDHGPGCVTDDPDDYVPPRVLELCDGVDVLIHDAQHTLDEYEAKRHFGHSSIEYAVHVAHEAGVKRLVLFHHCPTHSDDDVDAILTHARDLASRRGRLEVVAAHEGMRLELGGAT